MCMNVNAPPARTAPAREPPRLSADAPGGRHGAHRIGAQTLSAFLMLVSGIGLNVASFCLPPAGELSDSTMAFMGEALIYAASVFGMKAYVEQRLRNLPK